MQYHITRDGNEIGNVWLIKARPVWNVNGKFWQTSGVTRIPPQGSISCMEEVYPHIACGDCWIADWTPQGLTNWKKVCSQEE